MIKLFEMTYLLIIIAILFVGYTLFVSAIPAGNFKNISAKEARALIKDVSVISIDVRSPAEIQQGKIMGALELNIADSQFEAKLDKLDKSLSYLVYCRSGRRSARACQIMESKGFDKLYNLTGGFSNWKRFEN